MALATTNLQAKIGYLICGFLGIMSTLGVIEALRDR